MSNVLSLVDIAGSQENWIAYQKSIQTMLPGKDVKEARRYLYMYRQIMNKFMVDPKVTNKKSILTCMYNAPKFQLNPDPVFGHIWFVPYKGVLTYQLGYKGMIAMSLRSGKVINVRSSLVYQNDEWDYYEDETGQHYIHRPKFEKDRGEEVCGYSIFTDKNSRPNIHVMETSHINEIKKLVLARMKNGSPWSNKLFEPEMRKKSVVRRHWKYEPMSIDIAEAIENEERNESGDAMSEEEHKNTLENIIENVDVADNEYPDIGTEEGKKLDAELNGM